MKTKLIELFMVSTCARKTSCFLLTTGTYQTIIFEFLAYIYPLCLLFININTNFKKILSLFVYNKPLCFCFCDRNICLPCSGDGRLSYCHHHPEPPPSPQSGPIRSAKMAQDLHPQSASQNQLSNFKGQRLRGFQRGFQRGHRRR